MVACSPAGPRGMPRSFSSRDRADAAAACTTQSAKRNGDVTGNGLGIAQIPASLDGVTTIPVTDYISAPGNAIETHMHVAHSKPTPLGWAGTDDFEILSAYFKPYAAVRHVHYGAQAALGLRPQVELDKVQHINLWVYQEAVTYCGVRQPQTPLQAQFSLSFGVAAMLRWGHLDSAVYASPAFEDELLHSLEKKVAIHVHADWTQQQSRCAMLRISLADGRVVEKTCTAVLGDADMPWREQDLMDKFITNCQGSLSPARSQLLAEHILHAPDQAPIFPR